MTNNLDSVFYSDVFKYNQSPAFINDTTNITTPKSTSSIFHKNHSTNKLLIQNMIIQKSDFQPFWILLSSLLVFAILRLIFSKYLKYRIMGFFVEKYHGVNYTSEQAAGLIPRIINILFYVNIAVFIFELLPNFNTTITGKDDLKFYLIIALIVFLFSLSKTVIIALSGLLFSSFSNSVLLINIKNDSRFVKTVALVPINFVLIYGDNSMIFNYISLGIIASLFFIKVFKMYLQIRISTSYQVYQIILYLCSLEILPFFILYKFINNYI